MAKAEPIQSFRQQIQLVISETKNTNLEYLYLTLPKHLSTRSPGVVHLNNVRESILFSKSLSVFQKGGRFLDHCS